MSWKTEDEKISRKRRIQNSFRSCGGLGRFCDLEISTR